MAYQNLIKVDQLTSENYDIWKIQMESLLIKSDLWEYVSGKIVAPTVADKKPEWDKIDKKAKADLILAISPPLLKDVKNCETSNEVWTKLNKMFGSHGPAKKASLLKKLITTKMRAEENVNVHMSNFFDVVDKLKSIDIEIDDDLLSILLLYSLPDKYENFRIAIESRDTLPKPDALKVKIMEEFEARNAQDTNGEALFVNQRNERNNFSYKNYQRKKGEQFNRIVCYKCRKYGHKAAQCKGNFKLKEKTSIVEESTLLVNQKFNSRTNKWILDSGATSHMCVDSNKFEFLDKTFNSTLSLANGETTEIKGKGKIRLSQNVTLNEVLYVPELRTNLLSVNKITENNHNVVFSKNKADIKNDRNITILKAKKINSLYQIEINYDEANTVSENENLEMWHRRYGHINYKTLRYMIQNAKIRGVNPKIIKNDHDPECTVCIQGKQSSLSYPKRSNYRSSMPLELIHSDVCGPIKTKSEGGAQYFVTFIDDATRWCEIYVIKNKFQVFEMFKQFKAKAENFIERKIKILRTDNGKEYINKNFAEFLQKYGIQHQTTATYSPQQNGVAERKNRTLLEMARCMLIQANLPNTLWAEAISTANYIRNRSSSKSLENETPYKLWKGRNPEVKHLRTFGCLAYVLEKGPGKGKFEKKSKPYYLMGYCENSKAYRLWSKETKNIVKSRDVLFVNEFNKQKIEGFCPDKLEIEEREIIELYNDAKESEKSTIHQPKHVEDGEKTTQKEIQKHKELEKNETETKNEEENTVYKKRRGRPRIQRTGKRGRPRKLLITEETTEKVESELGSSEKSSEEYTTPDDGNESFFEGFVAAEENPTNINEVLQNPYIHEWRKAMIEELEAHEKNGTWEILEKPENVKVVGCRWVFATKTDKDDNVVKRKARLVAKGCNQRPGIDYHETYAPVAKYKSIRILIAIAVQWGLELYHFDVVTAYLNGNLNETIYMKLPEYYEELKQEKFDKNFVCKLKKAIYGLKQSGREWYSKLDEYLQYIGFNQLKSESCFYILKQGNDVILLVIYVDDLILASNSVTKIKWFKESMKNKFEIKDIGKLNYCLGMEFEQYENGDILLSQKKFIQKILKKFNMENANPVSIPMCPGEKISFEMSPKTIDEKVEMEKIPYQNLIGSLLYLSITTRPDISFAVNFLSKFNSNYGKGHWTAAKKILRYLKRTINYGLYFRKTDGDLEGYADADWGSDLDDRRSCTGYVFKLAGTSISWESKRQRTVALSSCEAEYMSMTEATKEAIYLKNVLREIEFRKKLPVTIYNDNLSAQQMAKNSIINSRCKHIDIRHHFIREAVKNSDVILKHMETSKMPADIFTKSLSSVKFKKCLNNLGLVLTKE